MSKIFFCYIFVSSEINFAFIHEHLSNGRLFIQVLGSTRWLKTWNFLIGGLLWLWWNKNPLWMRPKANDRCKQWHLVGILGTNLVFATYHKLKAALVSSFAIDHKVALAVILLRCGDASLRILFCQLYMILFYFQ